MKKKRTVQNRHSHQYSSFIRTSLITLLIMAGIFGIILILLYQQGKQRSTAQKPTHQHTDGMQVLGESDMQLDGRFIVNVPTEFSKTISAPGQTLDLGDGTIIAGNIITQLGQGQGIQVISGRTPTIINTDPGSAQRMFQNIKIGGTTIQADQNADQLEIEAGDNIKISADGKKIRISGIQSGSSGGSGGSTTIIQDDDGFTDTGSTISLENATDRVALGTDIAEGKLTVQTESDAVGLVITGAVNQQANLTEWRDANGNELIVFDNQGNAIFNGTITQNGSNISGDTVAFTGSGGTLVLDIQTSEPANLLENPTVDTNIETWDVNSPTAINQTVNREFSTDLSGWTGEIIDGSFQELFTNTGFESNLNAWDLSGGGLYSITESNTFTSTPYHVTRAPDGSIWYTTTSNKIGRVTTTGVVTEFTTPSALNIGQITTGPDGFIWYISSSVNRIGKVNPSNGVITEYTIASGGQGIAAGPDGNIWFTMTGSSRVGRITTNGVVTGNFNTTTNQGPRDIVAGPDGNMYIIFETSGRVGRMNMNGDLIILGNTGTLPRGATVGPDGNIWYAVFTGNAVGRVSLPSGTITEFSTAGASLTGMFDITSADGYLWVTATGSRRIARITTTGTITSYSAQTGANPRGIAVGSDGNLWYASESGNSIGRFQIIGPERVTNPTFSISAGAIRIPANAEATNLAQFVNVGDTRQYLLTAHVYVDGTTPVTSSIAQLAVNGSTVPTTYSQVGGGWYKLEAVVTGANASVRYGILVRENKQVFIDALSLKAASTASRLVNTFYDQIGSAQITAPADNDVSFVQTLPFNQNAYTMTVYAYRDGNPVTNADLTLTYNGQNIPTQISTTSKVGWYKLEGAFTATNVSTTYGIRVFKGKTVAVDSIALSLANIAASAVHSTEQPTYGTSPGAVRLNAIGRTPVQFTQAISIPTAGTYSFITRVYNITPGNVEGTISSGIVRLSLNGNHMSGVSYVAASGGFYTVTGTAFLAAGSYTIGLEVQTGHWVVADSFSLQQGSGNDKTVYIVNSGSGLAKMNVESTTFLNSGVGENQALIISGAANQAANLTEWRDVNNNILAVVDEQGRFGIGTGDPALELVVSVQKETSPAVAFLNTNSTDSPLSGILRLGTGVAETGTDTRFIQFYAGATSESNGVGVGRIRLNNGGVAYESGGADFAEYFTAEKSADTYAPGTVMVINTAGKVDTSTREQDANVLGVVSDTAAFVGNAKNDSPDATQVLVGLVGQIQTQVTDLNGPVRAGDKLTVAPIAGYAMKATGTGAVLGTALESFDPASGTSCSTRLKPAETGERPESTPAAVIESASASDAVSLSQPSCGRILVYVDSSWMTAATAPSLDAISMISSPVTATATEAAVFNEGISVLGLANVYDLSVMNSISAGQLQINGLTDEGDASISTLTGNLLLQAHAQGAVEFVGSRIVFDRAGNIDLKEGNLKLGAGQIIGNSSFVGSATIPAGKTSVRVDRDWNRPPASVQLTPEYNTNSWVTEVSQDGFTIMVDKAPEQSKKVYWQVLFIE